jgi:hypothetical protein
MSRRLLATSFLQHRADGRCRFEQLLRHMRVRRPAGSQAVVDLEDFRGEVECSCFEILPMRCHGPASLARALPPGIRRNSPSEQKNVAVSAIRLDP